MTELIEVDLLLGRDEAENERVKKALEDNGVEYIAIPADELAVVWGGEWGEWMYKGEMIYWFASHVNSGGGRKRASPGN